MARSALADGLTGDVKLGKLWAVRSSDDPPPLGGFREGLYFISGDLRGAGLDQDDDLVTWATSRDFIRTGGGLAFSMDVVTREFSNTGDRVELDKLGLSTAFDGYTESRDCVDS